MCGHLTGCYVEFDPNSFELDDPQVVELANRLTLPPAAVQAGLNATFADLSRFRRPKDMISFEGLRPTVLQALAQASGQPVSVVTLVLTGLSDWFEAHTSGVVITERWELAPDDSEGNGNPPPPPGVSHELTICPCGPVPRPHNLTREGRCLQRGPGRPKEQRSLLSLYNKSLLADSYSLTKQPHRASLLRWPMSSSSSRRYGGRVGERKGRERLGTFRQ